MYYLALDGARLAITQNGSVRCSKQRFALHLLIAVIGTTMLAGAQRSMQQLASLAQQAGYKVVVGYKHRTMVSTLRLELA